MEENKIEFRKVITKKNQLKVIFLLCDELGLSKHDAIWYVLCKGLCDIKKRKDYEENKLLKELKEK